MSGRLLASLLGVLLLSAQHGHADPFDDATGTAIMRAVHERHQQYPHVYEEQVMVLVDRGGNRDTRRLRRFTRVEDDGSVRFLLLLDAPSDVLGVAVMAVREPGGATRQWFYLPALGGEPIEAEPRAYDSHFLGSDFTVESLTGEVLDDYLYVRRRDQNFGGERHFRIDVFAAGADPEADLPLRRHYVREDILFIVRTDHFDDLGRIRRSQTHHDLVPVGGGVWRPNLLRMNNLHDGRQSLLRIERRIFSADRVPAEMFSTAWIVANQPPLETTIESESATDDSEETES